MRRFGRVAVGNQRVMGALDCGAGTPLCDGGDPRWYRGGGDWLVHFAGQGWSAEQVAMMQHYNRVAGTVAPADRPSVTGTVPPV